MRRLVLALALAATLAFGSGAFAHFIYPGQSETVTQVTVQATPVVARCDQFWQLMAEAQTERAAAILRQQHPDRDCLGPVVQPGIDLSGLAPVHLP
jgi:hypothetical protein